LNAGVTLALQKRGDALGVAAASVGGGGILRPKPEAYLEQESRGVAAHLLVLGTQQVAQNGHGFRRRRLGDAQLGLAIETLPDTGIFRPPAPAGARVAADPFRRRLPRQAARP